MRKYLLLMLIAVLLPCLAWADNMAIDKKRAAAYGSTNRTENRLGIPLEALGFSNPMKGSECYTVAAWIKPSNVYNNTGVLLALNPQVHMNDNGNWVLRTTASGALSLTGHGGDNHGAASVGLNTASFSRGVNVGEWNYVTVVVDNANLRFAVYVNGENALDTRITGPLYFPANLVNGDDGPGWIHVGGYALDAVIDEVHGFNRALTAAEVATAYESPLGINGLTGYYTFDEPSATEGYFDNLAPAAAANSSAVFWKWSTSNSAWGWVNGTNTPTAATLVAGRGAAQTPKSKLTVMQPEGGVITVMSGKTVVESGSEIEAGTELSLSIALEKGYELISYTLNGQPFEGNTVTAPEEAFTISATLDSESDVVATRSFEGKAEYYASGQLLEEYPGKTLVLKELTDGTYTIAIDNVPEKGSKVTFEGITREGILLSATTDSFLILGIDLGETTLEGEVNSSGISVEINGYLYGYMPITLLFTSEGYLSAIDTIAGDRTDVPAEYFTLQGIPVAAGNLTPGLYIMRKGNAVSKVLIRK